MEVPGRREVAAGDLQPEKKVEEEVTTPAYSSQAFFLLFQHLLVPV